MQLDILKNKFVETKNRIEESKLVKRKIIRKEDIAIVMFVVTCFSLVSVNTCVPNTRMSGKDTKSIDIAVASAAETVESQNDYMAMMILQKMVQEDIQTSITTEVGEELASEMQTIAKEEVKKQEEKKKAEEAKKRQNADKVKLMAAIIFCEAGNQSYDGKVAVGAVIMNRVRSSRFPNTIEGVIYQRGQFTPAMTGKLDRVLASGNIPSSCYDAARDALNGANPIGGALFFNTGHGRFKLGDHWFS